MNALTRCWDSEWTGGDFRQRSGAALTHPATVAALGVLLLNDLLFKSLWPHSWFTGKLSDLAWLVLALPLMAFLLSLIDRGNLRVQRVSFLVAYVGLPLLYASYNTCEPVHYWVLRGISIVSGGTAGSPLDVTDSLIIPFGWGIALWIWRREAAGPGALRTRWALLVAGIASLASVATSYPDPEYGVQGVGTSEDGTIHADTFPYHEYVSRYRSVDGGVTWTYREAQEVEVAWGSLIAETPRGTYTLDGPYVMRTVADGRRKEVAYSAKFLQRDGNVWVQEHATAELDVREIASKPLSIAYDDHSGNVVVAMGIQGVVIGTPGGRWTRTAVGRYSPTDFSFFAKTALLLSNLGFWSAALALSASMTAFGLILSQHQRKETWALPAALVLGVAIVALIVALTLTVMLTGAIALGPPVVPVILLGPFGLALATGSMAPRALWRGRARCGPYSHYP